MISFDKFGDIADRLTEELCEKIVALALRERGRSR